ncbi:MAG: hydrogenase accessory protein [Gammaproteobacteria bacterium]|nr:hydrogenase accessory protein [Gammaproteobacteria bacterium]
MTEQITLHPLFARLMNEFGASLITQKNIDSFLSETDDLPTVLLFAGDPVRRPEGLDVAVILPELMTHFPNQCRIALISPEDDQILGKQFDIDIRPTLVFLRGTHVITKIIKLHDWQIYLDLFGQALTACQNTTPIGILGGQTEQTISLSNLKR